MKNVNATIAYYSNMPVGEVSSTWDRVDSYEYFNNNNNGEILLEDTINLYLEYIRHSKAQNTHYCYSRDLYYLLEKFGNVKLNSITWEILQSVVSEILDSGIKKLARSGTTLNRIKSVYRSFFSWCFKKTTSTKICRAKFALQNLLLSTLLQ